MRKSPGAGGTAGAPASCVTPRMMPPMVKVPDLDAPEFAVTAYDTVRVPVPLAPDVIVIQLLSSVTVQEQLLPVDTVTTAVSAEADHDWTDGESE